MLFDLDFNTKVTVLGKLHQLRGVTLTHAQRAEQVDLLDRYLDWSSLMADFGSEPARIEIPENERYLVADAWMHCFVGSKGSMVCWAYDRQTDQFVSCLVQCGLKWEACSERECADVRDGLACNDIFEMDAEALEDYRLELTGELPDWARKR